MEKLELASGKKLNLIVCGIIADTQNVTIKILPDEASLDRLNMLLMDPSETEKMKLLSDMGDELAIYNGYTQLSSLTQEMNAVIGYTQGETPEPIMGKLVTAQLHKPDLTEARLESAEAQLTDIQMALCEVYEML